MLNFGMVNVDVNGMRTDQDGWFGCADGNDHNLNSLENIILN
jgi:hypothetical protein